MRRRAKTWNDKIVGRLCQSRMLSGFAFVLSANGAVFIASLGQRPKIGEKTNISAEGAIHFPPQLTTRTDLIRAFSACFLGIQIPGAMPQADNDIAPLALIAHRSAEPGRGDASETDEKDERQICRASVPDAKAFDTNALQLRGFRHTYFPHEPNSN